MATALPAGCTGDEGHFPSTRPDMVVPSLCLCGDPLSALLQPLIWAGEPRSPVSGELPEMISTSAGGDLRRGLRRCFMSLVSSTGDLVKCDQLKTERLDLGEHAVQGGLIG